MFQILQIRKSNLSNDSTHSHRWQNELQKKVLQVSESIRKQESTLFHRTTSIRNKEHGKDGSHLQSAQRVTHSLQQALEMMNNELERSIESNKTLDSSTKILEKTRDEYTTYQTWLSRVYYIH